VIDLVQLEHKALAELKSAKSRPELDRWRAEYLGRRSTLAGLLGELRALPADVRPGIGKRANELKAGLVAALDEHARRIPVSVGEAAVDTSLPGRPVGSGRLHPITSTLRRMRAAFSQMGFQVFHGRDVESDAYNFALLNMPPYHPARDSHDTFYTTRPDVLLRTHTSPAQIRVMRETGVPVRAVVPGACYRYDQPDASHNSMFHQMEGFAVGRGIRMTD
jgi:phenylalanyl-tRNA synthetase alpha chain